jgi:hypothetical protein
MGSEYLGQSSQNTSGNFRFVEVVNVVEGTEVYMESRTAEMAVPNLGYGPILWSKMKADQTLLSSACCNFQAYKAPRPSSAGSLFEVWTFRVQSGSTRAQEGRNPPEMVNRLYPSRGGSTFEMGVSTAHSDTCKPVFPPPPGADAQTRHGSHLGYTHQTWQEVEGPGDYAKQSQTVPGRRPGRKEPLALTSPCVAWRGGSGGLRWKR